MLLLADGAMDERRKASRGPLGPLYDSLVTELEPLVGRAPYIPEAKALLSRAGGRCELDGADLEFDPWSPHAHRCPTCGALHKGELHHRAWITSYQLWLAERSVHAALFYVLRGEERHARLARQILRAYADRYLNYPNRDNVLGPTRLFFSTYLESIWLLQICVAADLLAYSGDASSAAMVRDKIVGPSSALIAEYDEGMSNRQVWNNAALLAAAALRGDEASFDGLIGGESGLRAHLSRALLPDGTWYEGENYHLFALRGLWYCVAMCEARGRPLDAPLRDRFQRAFATPFVTALPDFTMPSRKDSRYAVSLRQWRIAELAELGLARRADPILAGALAKCYEPGHEPGRTGRARSTADVERSAPPAALSRADLGWRALLHARPDLPDVAPSAPRSALFEGQGFAVFRRESDIYVGFEFGQSGGGHGHPDRLNVVLSQGETRWLDDLGTGSYVDTSLHWYRSTLAHNAPLVDGRSQPLRAGALRAYDEREGLGWIVGEFRIGDVLLERTLVVAPDYLLDELHWSAPSDVRVELPWHLSGGPADDEMARSELDGGAGLEDGFTFVRDARARPATAGIQLVARWDRDGKQLRTFQDSNCDYTWFVAAGPGQPATEDRDFVLFRARAKEGMFRSLLTWNPLLAGVDFDAEGVSVAYATGERHTHRRDASGWRMELATGDARSSIDLAGWRPAPDARQESLPAARNPTVLRRTSKAPGDWYSEIPAAQRSQLLTFELGEPHYRRSEDAWKAAGSPHATIALASTDRHLIIFAHVKAGEPLFAKPDTDNSFDNEHADTLAAGLQLYARSPEGSGGWMLVPEPDGQRVRVRPIKDWGTLIPPDARWRADASGYEMRIALPLFGDPTGERPLDVDLIINETTAQRERRRGQLVLSGARGEFVYLRGDRHEPTRLLPLVLVP
jgi:hypothetical protein